MGQTVLQGCQLNCRGQDYKGGSRGKKEIYLNGMLAQLPDYTQKENNLLRNSVTSLKVNNNFLIELKDVPNHYLQFINYLFTARNMFEDSIFQINEVMFNMKNAQVNCTRLSQFSPELAQLCSNEPALKSKTILLLQLLEKHLPQLLISIKPIYLPKVGFALCRFYLNGALEQIVIDDRVPVNCIKFLTQKNYWFLLVQKAMAKAVGSYAQLQLFSLVELYQEITGLSLQPISEEYNDEIMDSKEISFKEGIQYQSECFLAGQKNQIYRMYLINNNLVKSISINLQNSVNFFRLKVDQKQKMSIRLSLLNWKYQYSEQLPYQNLFEIRLYEDQSFKSVIMDNTLIGNSIYLGKRTFNELNKGNYIISVKQLNSRDKKANLVYYGSSNIHVKQVISKGSSKFIVQSIQNAEIN